MQSWFSGGHGEAWKVHEDRRTRRIIGKWEEVASKRHRAESNPRSRSKRTVTKHSRPRLGIERSFLAFSTVRNQRTSDLARVHKGSVAWYLTASFVGKKYGRHELRGERFFFFLFYFFFFSPSFSPSPLLPFLRESQTDRIYLIRCE